MHSSELSFFAKRSYSSSECHEEIVLVILNFQVE